MYYFALGETLEQSTLEEIQLNDRSAVIIAKSTEAVQALAQAEIIYDGDISMSSISLCKLETQQECLYGTLCIPKLLNVQGNRYQMYFFINRKHIVIVDDDGFAMQLIRRIRKQKTHQGSTRERFLYNFIAQFISTDLRRLAEYEHTIMELEEGVLEHEIEDFEQTILPLRRELLILRGYYDEVMDLGKALEEDENHFFSRKQLKFFGTIADRADRLLNRTIQLLEYAQQVRDAYQIQVNAKQNDTMQFLTVISTIFFPLTLITSWYGMNFQNMPELEQGYPAVIALAVLVLVVTIIIFKKNKML